MYLQLFPHPRIEGELPSDFWHLFKNGGRKTPRPSNDGWAVGNAWALSWKSTGGGRAGAGCGRPGPALFWQFLASVFESDHTLALSMLYVSLLRGDCQFGESPPQMGSSKFGPHRMVKRNPRQKQRGGQIKDWEHEADMESKIQSRETKLTSGRSISFIGAQSDAWEFKETCEAELT